MIAHINISSGSFQNPCPECVAGVVPYMHTGGILVRVSVITKFLQLKPSQHNGCGGFSFLSLIPRCGGAIKVVIFQRYLQITSIPTSALA